MNNYMIWFEQINAEMIDIQANNIDEAKILAKKKWREENYPIIVSVREAVR